MVLLIKIYLTCMWKYKPILVETLLKKCDLCQTSKYLSVLCVLLFKVQSVLLYSTLSSIIYLNENLNISLISKDTSITIH